ncbi:MAG TPA: hypothetical protein PK752_22005, partial [Accumulibacter sp.]|nr:hypothetical protein [Accumulibacter sp.]
FSTSNTALAAASPTPGDEKSSDPDESPSAGSSSFGAVPRGDDQLPARHPGAVKAMCDHPGTGLSAGTATAAVTPRENARK